MIEALVALLFCQLAGEALVRALALPLPGPVAGMLLLFLILVWRGRRRAASDAPVPDALADVSDALLRNLSLLFIPAAVGIVQHVGLLRENGVAIGVAIVISSALAMAVTALVFEHLGRWLRRAADLAEGEP